METDKQMDLKQEPQHAILFCITSVTLPNNWKVMPIGLAALSFWSAEVHNPIHYTAPF